MAESAIFAVLTGVLVVWAALIAGVLYVGGYVDITSTTITETYGVPDNATLTVDNTNGKITIVTWDQDDVMVSAKLWTIWGEDELEKVAIAVDNSTDFSVATEAEAGAQVLVSYTISIPADLEVIQVTSDNAAVVLTGTRGDVHIDTTNGYIDVTDHTGNVTAESSNGWFEITEVVGDVVLESSNGHMEVSDISGDVNTRSSNGDIKITGVSGVIKARTSNGAITITDAHAVETARSSNGPIEVHVSNITDEGMDIDTSNAPVRLYLASSIDADLDIETSNGNIELHDLTITLSRNGDEHLTGALGAGGPSITIDTSNGDVDVYGGSA